MTRGPGSSCFKGELHVMLSAWINCFGKNVGKTDYSIHWAVIYLVDSITPPEQLEPDTHALITIGWPQSLV